jgi:gliding motility-associated-like protein
MKFNRVPSLLFTLILSFSGIAQITIDNTTYSTTQLVDGVLVPTGSGTVISNVTYQGVYNNGGDYQVGHFSTVGTTQTELGFTEGVVLTTGHTSDIPLTLGTNPGSVGQMSTGYFSSVPGEIRQSQDYILDLDILAGPENYFNASILEFDFIPSQSFVEFRYVFGSEEYSDDGGFINYQCTAYNDKFGFLISGPGISGGQGYTNDAENIAILANGSEVGINSVNDGTVGSSATPNGPTYCSSENPGWVQNVSTAEYGGTIDGTELNGNTIALTATKTGLTPGQTYHMKLAIMDVNDGAYDAVVYLEAGSFTTEAPTCGITDITAGAQTACDPLTNEYTQEVTVTYANPPATGTLDVNGQSFAIGTSPQTVTLTGLTADGNAVDVTAVFSDDAGCSFTVNSLFIAAGECEVECGELYVPTAFSPNGDDNNDKFMFRLNKLCVESMELSVYNRWGERIFMSENMSKEWDGRYKDKPCETGVYVYKLLIKIQGETDARMETGNINLIR